MANTVTLGAVAWPLMRKAGYAPEAGGAVLAAAGIGAILAPPVMGATAFLMAEFLKVSYFDVATMAIVPAALYYGASIAGVGGGRRPTAGRCAARSADTPIACGGDRRGWHHFVSFVVMVTMMVRGVTAFSAVFWATVVAFVVSFRHRERGADAATAGRSADGRRAERRADRGHHGRRRDHRRRDHADRPGPQGRVTHRDAGRRQPRADRRVRGARRVGAGPGRAGDGVLHHRGRDGGARR